MKLRKVLAVTAIATIAAASLAGCSSGTKETEAAAETEAATEAAETEAATEAAESTAEIAADTVYNIGILQLVQHDALDRATTGFEDALTDLIGADHLNFDLQIAQGDTATCATIANGFVSSNYDLLMANATASLQACAAATADIPIVGTSITSFPAALDYDDPDDHTTGINVTGTNDLSPLKDQAEELYDLFPDCQQIGILYCSAEVNSVYQAEHIQEYFDELGLSYECYTFSDSNDLSAVMNKVVSECDVIYIPTDNTAASNTELIDGIARPAGVPIIAGEEGICSGCGVATVSIDFYDIGYRAGEMAADILLNGADPASMPVEDPPTCEWKYNAEICESLGIEVSDAYSPLE